MITKKETTYDMEQLLSQSEFDSLELKKANLVYSQFEVYKTATSDLCLVEKVHQKYFVRHFQKNQTDFLITPENVETWRETYGKR